MASDRCLTIKCTEMVRVYVCVCVCACGAGLGRVRLLDLSVGLFLLVRSLWPVALGLFVSSRPWLLSLDDSARARARVCARVCFGEQLFDYKVTSGTLPKF